MKRKYIIPYLFVTLPLGVIMTLLLALAGRVESHAAIAAYVLVCFVLLPETVLWKLLFRYWCRASYWRMAEHVTIINICLFLTCACVMLGSSIADTLGNGLAFVPALIPYSIGIAYICFFAKRNEKYCLYEMRISIL